MKKNMLVSIELDNPV